MQSNYEHNNTRLIYLEAGSPGFDKVYLDYFVLLRNYAYTIVGDDTVSEEMVHQVFLKLLEKQGRIEIHTSLKAYLYRSVYYECMNYLKHQKVKQNFDSQSLQTMNSQAESAISKLQYKELEQRLKNAINELPEQCRTIFQLSRFEELKYVEIADQLGLSVKTVETQMSRALKKLRLKLADYLPFVLWVLINLM